MSKLYVVAKHGLQAEVPKRVPLSTEDTDALIAAWMGSASADQQFTAEAALLANAGQWLACGCQDQDGFSAAPPILNINHSPGGEHLHLHRPPRRPLHDPECPFFVSEEDYAQRRAEREKQRGDLPPTFMGEVLSDEVVPSIPAGRSSRPNRTSERNPLGEKLVWVMSGAGLVKLPGAVDDKAWLAIRNQYASIREFLADQSEDGVSLKDLFIIDPRYIPNESYLPAFYAISHKTPENRRSVAYLLFHAVTVVGVDDHTAFEVNVLGKGQFERKVESLPCRLRWCEGVAEGTSGPYLVVVRLSEKIGGKPLMTQMAAVPLLSIKEWIPVSNEAERLVLKRLQQVQAARQRHGGNLSVRKRLRGGQHPVLESGFLLEEEGRKLHLLISDQDHPEQGEGSAGEIERMYVKVSTSDKKAQYEDLDAVWSRVFRWILKDRAG